MEQKIILSRLLDKYEKSKHLFDPSYSGRRVMLRIEKKELPEYLYENAEIRDRYNRAAQELEYAGLISIEWTKGRPLLFKIILNLDEVLECYRRIQRSHPKRIAENAIQIITEALSDVSTLWIDRWAKDFCKTAQEQWKVPTAFKQNETLLKDLVKGLSIYDALQGKPITMRTFSSNCYHDTKYFERNIRDTFLNIARKYDEGLMEVCEHQEMGVRDQLAYLGIYARPELYELSGNFALETESGTINVGASYPFGLALPSTLIDSIRSLNLSRIHKIVFIENKTNYDEYLISELQEETLAIYHGGFLSPQKCKLFSLIAQAVPKDAKIYFWADIDLGGFRMFAQMQDFIPNLLPMRMSADNIVKYQSTGLIRSKEYLDKLKESLEKNEFPLFKEAIQQILDSGVTIEQEIFLT